MPRPKGFSPVGIYARDKQIRIPAAAEACVRAAVWAWELAQVQTEIADHRKFLEAVRAAARCRSRSQEKKLAQAARAKSKGKPATRKKAGIKAN